MIKVEAGFGAEGEGVHPVFSSCEVSGQISIFGRWDGAGLDDHRRQPERGDQDALFGSRASA